MAALRTPAQPSPPNSWPASDSAFLASSVSWSQAPDQSSSRFAAAKVSIVPLT